MREEEESEREGKRRNSCGRKSIGRKFQREEKEVRDREKSVTLRFTIHVTSYVVKH